MLFDLLSGEIGYINDCSSDVAIVGNARQLAGDCIERSEHIPTFSARRTTNENSFKTPQATKEFRLHKRCSIRKEQGRLTCLCFRYFRIQNVFKIFLLVRISLCRDGANLAKLHADILHENANALPTCPTMLTDQ